LGVDVENNFEPHYIIIKGKAKILNLLKTAAQKAEVVYLAPDPDREGEAIAWHLAFALGLEESKYRRVEFHEITKNTVQNALLNPRHINQNLVDAQQARRILDRLVGYSLSPLLWKKIRRGLSAGRVQSVAVRLICDRQDEIKSFVPVEYWSMATMLENQAGQKFLAHPHSLLNSDEKLEIHNQSEAAAIKAQLEQASFQVKEIRKKERKLNPPPPFITSTLQQEASRKLGYGARKTMMIAQQLYEGMEVGGGEATGLITYMRTDSTRISNDALGEAREFIGEHYGADYLPATANIYKSKKSAQDAHEAIRPTSSKHEPQAIKNFLTPEQNKIYALIWNRFMASQMNPAITDQTSVDIAGGNYLLRATGSVIKFAGFKTLYMESTDDNAAQDEDRILPPLNENEILKLQSVTAEQHFTQPPPYYTEASLIKVLEEKGIGRPSTYAPIISTIQNRNYVMRDQKKLVATDLGIAVNSKLMLHFPDIVDTTFTASVEEKLDSIEDGSIAWKKILSDFYIPFIAELKKAETEMESLKVADRPAGEDCAVCGKPMVIKVGRFGEFMACSGFPECKTTKAIIKPLPAPCPLCKGPLVKKRTKTYRFFVGCANYPKCDFASWDDPLPDEVCGKCGAFMVLKKSKGEEPRKLCIMCDIKNLEKKSETKTENA
jgi:DNA topoisomerase-1